MGYKLYNEDDVQSIADAIRTKNGTTEKYKLSEMAAAVGNINSELAEGFANLLQGKKYEINDKQGKITSITVIQDSSIWNYLLRKIYLPECTNLRYMAFMNCAKLEEAYLPKCKIFEDDSLGGQNVGMSSLSKVTLCDDITSIGKGFLDGSIIEELRLNNVGTIDAGFCSNCSKLRVVTFSALSSIDLNGENSWYTFGRSPLLKIVDFGNVTSINNGDENTWKHDVNLKAIVIRSETVPTLGASDAFVWLKNNVTGWKIYVQDSLVETYKTATNWSNYADYFAPLSEYNEETILNSADVDTSSAKAAILSEEETSGGEE